MADPDADELTDSAPAEPRPEAADPAGLDAVAERLYRVRPDEFVPERDAAVAQAREQDDRELARAIAKLRRPTRAAWLANLLARDRPEQLDGLLGLAAGLADAQRTLDGTALRTLSSQRHRLVAAVAQEAARVARAQHEPVSEGLLRELQGILEAALADPVIADEVRSGRLTRTVTYSGFGPPADPTATPSPPRREPPPAGGAGSGPPPPEVEDAQAETARRERERAERERREEALAAAQAEEETARDRQEADEAARDEALATRDAARQRVTELAEQLDAARDAERDATAAAREAESVARASARAAGAAATRTARALARLQET